MASATTSADRVAQLRHLMGQQDVRAYLVPSADPHLSEYLAPCFQRRAFISNFTGSSGTAIITDSKAALWTDGRYYLQGEQQLDAATFTLMRDGLPDTPTISAWLQSELGANARVGVDARAISINDAKSFGAGLELVSIKDNLIDEVWGAERPPFPLNVAVVQPLEYAGKSTADKVEELRVAMKERSADVVVIAALDEVAWLLNVRGSDVDFNPVVLSYVVVTHDEVRWYVCAEKVTDEVRQHLGDAVHVLPYEQIFDDLEAVPESHHVWLDGAKSTLALLDRIGHAHRIDENSPVAIPKAIKNEAEIAGFQECSLRDSVALVNFFAWLEAYLNDPSSPPINEVQAADKLLEFRQQQPLFVSKSFDTISSTGANGAIIHYKPAPETCATINKDHFYLCDSGGQYRNGTTDVTRTFHFGQPTEHERRCYTRVLQCHIALARTVFPHGTTGHKLDVISRTPLWEDGLDFRHGTGHGFGSFLNVHEGPTLISFRESTRGCYFSTPLRPNMTVTIEPGYYEDGHFGIRIENCTRIVDAKTLHNFGGTKFYAFEPFTLVPIQTRAVEPSLLTHEQRQWLNHYHETVAEKLAPHLSGAALEWMLRETRPI